MSYIPAGSLAFSGFANSTPQEVKFKSATGADLTHPTAAPVIGNPSSDYCDGFVCFDDGAYIAGSTLTFSGHSWAGERFNSAFGSGTPIGTIDGEPFIRSAVATDGVYAYGIYYHFSGGLFVAFVRFTSAGAISTTQVTTLAQALYKGDCLAVVNGVLYWGDRNGTAIYRWDTAGSGSDLGDWSVTAPAGHALYDGSLLGLQDGSIVVHWVLTAGSGSVVKRYDTSGTLLTTYTLPGTDPEGAFMTRGLTAASFWISNYQTGSSDVYLTEFNSSTAAAIHQWSVDASTYFYDGPFTVVRTAIGTPPVAPIPLPTPLAPQSRCEPSTDLISGGTGNSGCNDGGVGITSCS